MSTTVQDVVVGTTLKVQVCCECGVVFGLNDAHQAQLRKNHQTFYCPNGHTQHYVAKTEAEKLKDQLAATQRDADWQRQRRQDEARGRERAERQARALKGVITKTKRRVAHGVCPCCSRSFQDLQRHMAGKHPDYVASAKELA